MPFEHHRIRMKPLTGALTLSVLIGMTAGAALANDPGSSQETVGPASGGTVTERLDSTAGTTVRITGDSITLPNGSEGGIYQLEANESGSYLEAHGQCWFIEHAGDNRGNVFIPMKPDDFASFLQSRNSGAGFVGQSCCPAASFENNCGNGYTGTTQLSPARSGDTATATWYDPNWGMDVSVTFTCDGSSWSCERTVVDGDICPAGNYNTPDISVSSYNGSSPYFHFTGPNDTLTLPSGTEGQRETFRGGCFYFTDEGPGGQSIADKVAATDFSALAPDDVWSMEVACTSSGWAMTQAEGCHLTAAIEAAPSAETGGGCTAVGDEAFGGFCTQTGANAIVVAPASTATTMAWSHENVMRNVIDTLRGSINTSNLAAYGGLYPAAQYCENLSVNGYDDWYLPARDELNVVRNAHSTIGGFDYANPYWSSTEFSFGGAWFQYFNTGQLGGNYNTSKSHTLNVRCVRIAGVEEVPQCTYEWQRTHNINACSTSGCFHWRCDPQQIVECNAETAGRQYTQLLSNQSYAGFYRPLYGSGEVCAGDHVYRPRSGNGYNYRCVETCP